MTRTSLRKKSQFRPAAWTHPRDMWAADLICRHLNTLSKKELKKLFNPKAKWPSESQRKNSLRRIVDRRIIKRVKP